MVKSSSHILFFKQNWDWGEDRKRWYLYHSIKNVRGFIYFYLIDQETFMPILENVMYNFMYCDQMMVGSQKRYAITYKHNEAWFEIYRRKYMHNLRVNVNDGNFEGSKSIEIVSSNFLLVSQVD